MRYRAGGGHATTEPAARGGAAGSQVSCRWQSQAVLLVLDGEVLKVRVVRDGSYSVVFSSGVASDEVAVPLTLRDYVGECAV